MSEPYYQDELVTLYLGDCREIDAWLAADVLVTDPPYGRAWRQGVVKSAGSTVEHARNDASTTGIANDKSTEVRDAALRMWGDRHGDRKAIAFGDLMLPPPLRTKLVGVYSKPNDAGLRGAMGGVRRDAEAIYFIGRWPSGIGGRSSIFATRASLIGSPHGIVARGGGHPHTKPQDVLGELIHLTDGTIADPFSGGGSIAVAAKAAGRKCIAVELEERYCEIAARRLDQGVLDFGAAG